MRGTEELDRYRQSGRQGRTGRRIGWALLACMLAALLTTQAAADADPLRMLLFTKTTGFRHDSISTARDVLRRMGADQGFEVTLTEDAIAFTDESLAAYDVILFANTTGTVLNPGQKAAFERFIRRGGGFVGAHAASDTEYQWPFYEALIGAYFKGHPPGTSMAEMVVEDPDHPSTAHLGERFAIQDEWYFFDRNPRGTVHVLTRLDEGTLHVAGWGQAGTDHPNTWCHAYQGGRAWYTALGHRKEVWLDERYQQMLLGGILWAAGQREGDCRFDPGQAVEREVLISGLNEPLDLDVAADGRVFWVERPGQVRMWEEAKGATVLLSLPVFTENEHGLLGIALDPDFLRNRHLYLYYSPAGFDRTENFLSRFELVRSEDGQPFIDRATEKVLFKVGTDRATCCHQAGDLEFGPDGKIYLSTGDNTNPFESDGYAPIDERPGRAYFNAQRTSQNRQDLRGKILRLNADGTAPSDNPFMGDPNVRPEIWAMGFRNPFRISVDARTGWVLVGNVGPDAGNASPRGPAGQDEWEVVPAGGSNHGWPYCIGPNVPYRDYDFAERRSGEPFNCSGMTPAAVWYPYGASNEFPAMGKGGRTAIAGPIYRDPGKSAPHRLPARYAGQWFLLEWSRGFIKAASLSADGTRVLAIEDFLNRLSRPVAMKEGPGGALYLLEYGTEWSRPNQDARLSRISGRRTPLPLAAAVTAASPRLPPVSVHDDFADLNSNTWRVYTNSASAAVRTVGGKLRIENVDPGWEQKGIALRQPIDLSGRITEITIDYAQTGYDEQNPGFWGRGDIEAADTWAESGFRLTVGPSGLGTQFTPSADGQFVPGAQITGLQAPYTLTWVVSPSRRAGEFDFRVLIDGAERAQGTLNLGSLDPRKLYFYLYVSRNNASGPLAVDRVLIRQTEQ